MRRLQEPHMATESNERFQFARRFFCYFSPSNKNFQNKKAGKERREEEFSKSPDKIPTGYFCVFLTICGRCQARCVWVSTHYSRGRRSSNEKGDLNQSHIVSFLLFPTFSLFFFWFFSLFSCSRRLGKYAEICPVSFNIESCKRWPSSRSLHTVVQQSCCLMKRRVGGKKRWKNPIFGKRKERQR